MKNSTNKLSKPEACPSCKADNTHISDYRGYMDTLYDQEHWRCNKCGSDF